MPPLESLWRPLRLKMKGWSQKRPEWQEATRQALAAAEVAPADRFTQLEQMKQVALDCARRVLGETGGKIRSLIPHHSRQFRKLKARLTLLKVVWREIHARRNTGQQMPSRAMRSVWDGGLYPRPCNFSALSSLWSPTHQGWTEGWLRLLRQQSQSVEEEMHELRRTEMHQATEQSRQAAIDRFFDGGELRRLLHPQAPTIHSPMLRTCVPHSFVVAGDDLSLQTVATDLKHIGGLNLQYQVGSILVSGIRPVELLAALRAVAHAPRTVRLLQVVSRLAHSATDRLSAWEHSLTLEATAQQAVCPGCLGTDVTPVTVMDGGRRIMATWCSRCQATTTLCVHAADYAVLPFPLRSIPRVPHDAGATLQGAITEEDFEFFLNTLPSRKAPGPDGVPYELLKCAPAQLKEVVLECINAILTKQAVPPASWLGGLIRFLFKKGDLLDAANYRPVCLQDCVYKVLSAILTDRLYRLAERYGLIDPSQEGFRRLHSTQRQVQSLHWAFESASKQRKRLYVVYLDFANAFNSVDHEALWRWLQELNVPDVDLLQSLYHESTYVADLPYGQSAPISLTRGTKQGDKLSPLLFDLIFNYLLLALRATGVAHRLMTGLRTPARGFADDLVLCTESPEDMGRLLTVVAGFCQWSGMRVKLQKSIASAFDFAKKEELPTGGILYNGVPLAHLPADASFCYLGVRASILARTAGGRRPPRWRPSASPNLAAEKAHVFSATRELVGVAKQHSSCYLLSQMVPAMHMVGSARFSYSAALVPWSDSELDKLHKTWLQVHRAAWRLPPGFPSAPFVLPGEQAGLPVPHPRVVLVQALTTHIQQLCALPDELRQATIDRYRRLCNRCGCHNERELAEHLGSRGTSPHCPIARLLKACGQLGVQIRLPACLTLGKSQRNVSWHGLLVHLRGRASAPGAADQLRADVETVEASWPAIYRRLRRRGVGSPRMLVINPRGAQGVWLLPRTLPRNPGWLEPLRRALHCADTAVLFPLLDRGEGVPAEAIHQALLHDVLHGLRTGNVSVLSLFADDRWNMLRSSATWLSWQLTLQRHGLPVTPEVWATGYERARGPIQDLLLLGGCPDADPAVLRDLCVELAPYLRSASADHGMEDRGPLTWEPVRLLPMAAEFVLTDNTAGKASYGPYDTSTRDGLVRVERAGQHVGTVKQSRFGLLSAAYSPEELCRALPAWITEVETDESARGVPSTQYWTQVQGVLEGDCILGCNPLVAPAAFARAFRNMGLQEGWGHSDSSPLTRAVYSLLTLTRLEQRDASSFWNRGLQE